MEKHLLDQQLIPQEHKKIDEKLETALIQTFRNNQETIEQMLDDNNISEVDQSAIDEDIQNFPVEERIKTIMQQERQASSQRLEFYKRNETILKQLADSGSQKSVEFVLDEIKKDGTVFFDYHAEFIQILKRGNLAEISSTILENMALGTIEKYDYFLFVFILTEILNTEESRNKLNDLLHKERAKKENANQAVIDNLEYARSFITPNHEKIAVESLPDLYENKIKFETYGLNGQMQEKEIAFLEELIPAEQKPKVLEAGMGTGRLFLELQKTGYDITGFDFTQRHVALVRGEAPDAKVFKGDWKNNALQNESFDAVYSLGRNILHEYSLPDQVQMFREAARVLKKGGKFIFDIPDREKKDSEYKQRVKEYADTMRNEFHINNFRHGAIYDSPNGMDFATRYAYSHEDIENLAQLAGFRVAEVRREPLPTGKGDENLYYVLEKV